MEVFCMSIVYSVVTSGDNVCPLTEFSGGGHQAGQGAMSKEKASKSAAKGGGKGKGDAGKGDGGKGKGGTAVIILTHYTLIFPATDRPKRIHYIHHIHSLTINTSISGMKSKFSTVTLHLMKTNHSQVVAKAKEKAKVAVEARGRW